MSDSFTETSEEDYKDQFYKNHSSLIYKQVDENHDHFYNQINNKILSNIPLSETDNKHLVTILFKTLVKLINFKEDLTNNLVSNITNILTEYNSPKDVSIILTEGKSALREYVSSSENHSEEFKNICYNIDYILKLYQTQSKEETFLCKYNQSIYNPIFCNYKDYCKDCNKGSIRSDENEKYEYCRNCDTCNTFRDYDKKAKILEAKNLYIKDKYPKDNLKTTRALVTNDKTPVNTIVNNNIINNTMNINNIIVKGDVIMNFVITQDRYYQVMITQPDGLKDISQLKYVFICLMCGIKGKDLFPDEKHSTAKTFNVNSATYSINYKDDIPYLHGLIRYKTCNGSTTVTINKLKNINKAVNSLKKTIIDVRSINLWENEKHKYDVNDIKQVIDEINQTQSYGSTLEDFLKS
jgi:hypothetical protein